jgi:7-keto-8-aminopelargonate synthetase-like enzyme
MSFPAVSVNAAHIRLSVTSEHTEEQIWRLVDNKGASTEFGLLSRSKT